VRPARACVCGARAALLRPWNKRATLSAPPMVVGLLRIRLHIPEAHSLKDRRAAVRRAVERVRARFNVSVAEVGDLDRWQVATVAVAAVANDRAHINEVLDRVTSTIANAGAALVMDREMDLQSYGDREPLREGGFVVPRTDPKDPGDPGARGVGANEYAGHETHFGDAEDEGDDGDE
jgi:uncharacterized protein YlxP (DUF503 family)